jgi:hypothetical protein
VRQLSLRLLVCTVSLGTQVSSSFFSSLPFALPAPSLKCADLMEKMNFPLRDAVG